jgi:hypothetical protein
MEREITELELDASFSLDFRSADLKNLAGAGVVLAGSGWIDARSFECPLSTRSEVA